VNYTERAFTFSCAGETLVGVLAMPEKPRNQRGVLIVVGGPQYRVGSHRQFLLLSRRLAEAGMPVLRYDYRGMGDSSGDIRTFEAVTEDLRAAVDVFSKEAPSVKEVAIWGLCDAASAALMYAADDKRICALALANPWVRTAEGYANAMVKHYYGSRFMQWDFWRKLLSGQVNVFASLCGLLGNLRARAAKKDKATASMSLPDRMGSGLQRFSGPVMFLLSGEDLTAQEFEETIKSSPLWQRALERPAVEWRRLDAATHTFSSSVWRDQVADWTIEWVTSW